jgi:hypothetical protein
MIMIIPPFINGNRQRVKKTTNQEVGTSKHLKRSLHRPMATRRIVQKIIFLQSLSRGWPNHWKACEALTLLRLASSFLQTIQDQVFKRKAVYGRFLVFPTLLSRGVIWLLINMIRF